MRTHHLPIQGATCQGCAKKIRTALGAVPGADDDPASASSATLLLVSGQAGDRVLAALPPAST